MDMRFVYYNCFFVLWKHSDIQAMEKVAIYDVVGLNNTCLVTSEDKRIMTLKKCYSLEKSYCIWLLSNTDVSQKTKVIQINKSIFFYHELLVGKTYFSLISCNVNLESDDESSNLPSEV